MQATSSSRAPSVLRLAGTGSIIAIFLLAPFATRSAAQSRSPLLGVDVFGTRAFTAAEVRAEFGAELDSIARALSTGRLDETVVGHYRRVVETLGARGDFAYLNLSFVQYFDREEPTSYLTVDVVERADSARRMDFAAAPNDTVPDPDGLVGSFQTYLARGMALLQQGALRGPEPPCPVLHCAPGFHHEQLREESTRFRQVAPAQHAAIVRVLHRDADPARRAAAAFLLGYGADAAAVARALAPGVRDPSSEVRNNVLRVLIMLAQRQPAVEIPVAPVIAALHFPATTDRNKAGYVLLGLAARPEHREPMLRDAGPVLLDMLALEQPNNREPAVAVLQALSGESWEAAELDAWRDWWRRSAGR